MTDLRFLVGALKICSDLERMGDSRNVAKQRSVSPQAVAEFAQPFRELTEAVRSMVRRSIDAAAPRRGARPRGLARDAGVDEHFRAMLDLCLRLMKNSRATVEDATIYVPPSATWRGSATARTSRRTSSSSSRAGSSGTTSGRGSRRRRPAACSRRA